MWKLYGKDVSIEVEFTKDGKSSGGFADHGLDIIQLNRFLFLFFLLL